MVVFGGESAGTQYVDTWEYDSSNWREVNTRIQTPSARSGHTLVYDGRTGMVAMFGGFGLGGADVLAETWQYNGTGWYPVYTSQSPLARGYTAMVYDAHRQKLVIFIEEPVHQLICACFSEKKIEVPSWGPGV
jgi:hypothetical protein